MRFVDIYLNYLYCTSVLINILPWSLNYATASESPLIPSHGDVRDGVSAGCGDGYELVAQVLVRLGVKFMFGVVGIPVTPLASSAQVKNCRQ